MAEFDTKEYKSIKHFIANINSFSDDEILDKTNQFFPFLRKNGLYDLQDKLKISAIKATRDLSRKVILIREFYFLEAEDIRHCFSWIKVLASIDNLSEDDKDTVLQQVFLNQHFEEAGTLLNIPRDLKFGVELEYYALSLEEIKMMFKSGSIATIMKALRIPQEIIDRILNNYDFEKENEFDKWIFSKEGSDDLPEASSPILLNNQDCINDLKAICLLFKALCARLHGGTGLHINIGIDYFKGRLDALKYLLLIWGECEDLFYKIANKENELLRVETMYTALPIKANIQKTFKTNPDFTLSDQEDLTRFLYNIQVRERLSRLLEWDFRGLKDELGNATTEEKRFNIYKQYLIRKSNNDNSIKFTSMNFNHLSFDGNCIDGRIEFRIFNNSLDYEIIAQDILLIGKLIESCIQLANNSSEKQASFSALLNRDVTEWEKLNLLLDLLFDSEEEKEIFRKRWLSIKDNDFYKKFATGTKTFKTKKKEQSLVLNQ